MPLMVLTVTWNFVLDHIVDVEIVLKRFGWHRAGPVEETDESRDKLELL